MNILKRKPKRPKGLNIKDYTLSQFVSNGINDDIFRAVMRHIEPCNKIQGFEFVGFWNSQYKLYISIGKLLKKENVTYSELIDAVLKGSDAEIEIDIENAKMLEVYAFYKYVIDDYLANAKKFKYMQTTKDLDLEAAGVSVLDKYGDTLTVDSLAIRYQVQWEDVIKWKFSEVFTKLAMEADRSRVREAYQKIKMKTNATR